jgi:hypothetical protein
MTDRRLVFVALTGMRGRNTQSVDIPYSIIASLNVRKFGAWLLEVSSAAGEFQFSAGSRDGVVQLANVIRQCIDEYSRPEPSQQVHVPAIDPVDQLASSQSFMPQALSLMMSLRPRRLCCSPACDLHCIPEIGGRGFKNSRLCRRRSSSSSRFLKDRR